MVFILFFLALKKSQKEANSLAQKSCREKETGTHSQGDTSKSSKLESDLTGQWKSLFCHMEDILVRESNQLVSVISISYALYLFPREWFSNKKLVCLSRFPYLCMNAENCTLFDLLFCWVLALCESLLQPMCRELLYVFLFLVSIFRAGCFSFLPMVFSRS